MATAIVGLSYEQYATARFMWVGPTVNGWANALGPSYNTLNDPKLNRPDWWRCDGCGHANDWQHLACAHCGAQLPTRYDP